MRNPRQAIRRLATAAIYVIVADVTAHCASGNPPTGFDAVDGSGTGPADATSTTDGSGADTSTGPTFITEGGVAPTGDGCVPASCTTATGSYCGDIGNGCGGKLSCGDCPNAGICGGGGIPHVCELANCTPGSCTPSNGAIYYGIIGDGCGGMVDCGQDCPDGGVAYDGGPGVCPGTGVGACSGIQCNVATCPGGGTTSVSGTVYDPAAVNPIYDALVYIPNAALDPVPTGASCQLCTAAASGQPITSILTDTAGHFTLPNVPTGTNIPLVIQVGKWRREITVPTVTSCVDNPITDVQQTRLPRTQSEGNIPLIAVTTGGSDALECELRRIGLADSEFTTDIAGTGRVHLYYGGDLTGPTGGGAGTSSFSAGGKFSSAATLWSSTTKMAGYDMMMLSCEGGQYADAKKPYLPNMETYLDAGGRVFFGHLHFYWLNHGSAALQSTADYIGVGSDLPQPITGYVNTTFPKGSAMSDWMVNVGASTTPTQLDIYQGQYSVASVNAPTQAWITVPVNPNDSAMRPSVQYMTFNTPVGTAADAQCGRAVFTDLHMNVSVGGNGGDNSDPTKPFPTECKTNGMTPQAKALEFMFFDLSACLQSDTGTPVPPPVPPAVPPPPPPPTPPPQ
jgi:hypothetical protein